MQIEIYGPTCPLPAWRIVRKDSISESDSEWGIPVSQVYPSHHFEFSGLLNHVKWRNE